MRVLVQLEDFRARLRHGAMVRNLKTSFFSSVENARTLASRGAIPADCT